MPAGVLAPQEVPSGLDRHKIIPSQAVIIEPRCGEQRSNLSEQFIVDDHGSGIPDYAIDKIFDKFFSLQRPDSGKKSTGLGLNFVKEVVILHKGDITLENRPEKGVRATLTLPL